MERLFIAALRPQDLREQAEFFRDILTTNELRMIAQRWHIAEELWKTDNGYKDIAQRVETSTTTVGRVAHNLWYGEGGTKRTLEKLFPKIPDEDEFERIEMEKIRQRSRERHGPLYAKRGTV